MNGCRMNMHNNSAPSDGSMALDSVGAQIAATLHDLGVTTVFGVISIHNMPILDAIARQQKIRFVPARGEAGAMNMADAYARVSRGLGVVITSTGTGAGNAAGSQVEALTASSPVLHITTTVDRGLMDRDRAAIHDVPRQPDMLKAISKAYFRVWEARNAADMLAAAAQTALSAPSGPVTLEIPIDVQRLPVPVRQQRTRCSISPPVPDPALLDAVAELILNARRPMLWLGGGARGASHEATQLVERGFGAVTSTQGRAVVPEGHSRSLGAFNMTPAAEQIYQRCDLMLVVGSRLRGNETRNNEMKLPSPLVQIDAEPSQAGRNYPVSLFVHGDARLALEGLLQRLPPVLKTDDVFLHDISIARVKSEGTLRSTLGPYQTIADVLLSRVASGRHPFVRDVTLSNSTFGNRYVQIAAPHLGVHALGGGIGQGIAMSVGAALAGESSKTVALVGDGGAVLMIGELLTMVEQKANVVLILMNDRGYGVIRNIQDAQYQGRRAYADLLTPNFSLFCQSIGLRHEIVGRVDQFESVFDCALASDGPCVVEVDMAAIGPFAEAFSGPPAGSAGSVR